MMSNEVGERELFKDLHVVAPKWRMFGVFLKVPHNILKEFQGADCVVEECFMEILIRWLENCTSESNETKINQLVSALRFPGVDHMRLANEIDTNRAGVRLELDYLMEKLNPCKAKYFFLGLGLGLKGPAIKQIETATRSSTPVKICFHRVLIFWLNSTHTDLDILVKALENVHHRALAREIKEKYAGKKFVASKAEAATTSTAATTPTTEQPQYQDLTIPPGPVLDDPLHKKLEMKDHWEIALYLKDLDNQQLVSLGLRLGLHYSTLNKMSDLSTQLVHTWLLRQDDVIESGDPTFENLAKALEEIGQKGLALDVRQRKHAKRTNLERQEVTQINPPLQPAVECTEESPSQTSSADHMPERMHTSMKKKETAVQPAVKCTEVSPSQISLADHMPEQMHTSMKKKETAVQPAVECTEESPSQISSADHMPEQMHTSMKKKETAAEAVDSNTSATVTIRDPANGRIEDDHFFINWLFGGKEKIHFPAKDRGKHCAELKLDDDGTKITTIQPQSSSQPLTSVSGFYQMTANRHGVALIINNKKFNVASKERHGTERDEHNLIQTWLFLGYHIVVMRDCTKEELDCTFNKIDKMLNKAKDVAHDSFVCCILSHGVKGEVVCCDNKSMDYTDIIKYMSQSVILRDKPKMLFIQACQVPREPRVGADGPVHSDCYLSWATVEGYQAFRDKYTGSWYITELCKALCEYGKVTDLDDIQKTVNRKVSEKYKTPEGSNQQPHASDVLYKKVFFFNQ